MIDIEKLKKLRKKTGISIALCKKALEESNNNITQAEKLLTQWGAERIADKLDRKTPAGGIFSYVHHNKKIASLVEVLCETDFVAANAEFQTLGHELAMQVASQPAKDVNELLTQLYFRDPNKKISDFLKEAILKFGENIKINRFVRWSLD